MRRGVVKRIRRGLLLGVGSVVFTMLMLELLLRVFAPYYRQITQPDDLLGFSYIPNTNYTLVAREPGCNWGSSGTINSFGFLDNETTLETPPDTFRIMTIGDSFTEAYQFTQEEIWPALLEADLNALATDDGSTIEVINAARSGYGAALAYLYYRERGFEFNPDLVIWMFFYNDIVDDSREMRPQSQPYFFVEDGELVLDNSFRENPAYQNALSTQALRQNSLLVSFLRQGLDTAAQRQANIELASDIEADAAERLTRDDYEGGSDGFPYVGEGTRLLPVEYRALEITQRSILAFKEEVEANGGEFLMIVSTDPQNSNVDSVEAGRGDRTDSLTTIADDALVALAEDRDIPYLNMVPIAQDYVIETGNNLHGCEGSNWEGHYNLEGHRVVTDALVDYLLVNDLVPVANQ